MTSEKQPSSLWERLEKPAQAPRASLTHQQIAKAAIAIADTDGLAAVSMRRLAEALGVSTMALYRYVSSKNDIFELMSDALAAITLPSGDGTTWRTVLTSLAEQSRASALRHPWLIQIAAQHPHILTPNMLAAAEQVLTALDGLGLDVDTNMAITNAVISLTHGVTGNEIAQRQYLRRSGNDATVDSRFVFEPRISWIMGTGRYPTLTRYMVDGSNTDDAQWQFEFGLECLLDGIAARLGI